MKFLIVLAVIALATAKPSDDYSKFENFNVDEIIENVRLLKAYAQCFQGTGKCTAEGSDMKELIPESVQNNCAKCSEKEKTMVAKVILAVQKQLPDEWEKLNKMYNTDNKYDETLKQFLNTYGH